MNISEIKEILSLALFTTLDLFVFIYFPLIIVAMVWYDIPLYYDILDYMNSYKEAHNDV